MLLIRSLDTDDGEDRPLVGCIRAVAGTCAPCGVPSRACACSQGTQGSSQDPNSASQWTDPGAPASSPGAAAAGQWTAFAVEAPTPEEGSSPPMSSAESSLRTSGQPDGPGQPQHVASRPGRGIQAPSPSAQPSGETLSETSSRHRIGSQRRLSRDGTSPRTEQVGLLKMQLLASKVQLDKVRAELQLANSRLHPRGVLLRLSEEEEASLSEVTSQIYLLHQHVRGFFALMRRLLEVWPVAAHGVGPGVGSGTRGVRQPQGRYSQNLTLEKDGFENFGGSGGGGRARRERQPEQREQRTRMERMAERAHGRQRQ